MLFVTEEAFQVAFETVSLLTSRWESKLKNISREISMFAQHFKACETCIFLIENSDSAFYTATYTDIIFRKNILLNGGIQNRKLDVFIKIKYY